MKNKLPVPTKSVMCISNFREIAVIALKLSDLRGVAPIEAFNCSVRPKHNNSLTIKLFKCLCRHLLVKRLVFILTKQQLSYNTLEVIGCFNISFFIYLIVNVNYVPVLPSGDDRVSRLTHGRRAGRTRMLCGARTAGEQVWHQLFVVYYL